MGASNERQGWTSAWSARIGIGLLALMTLGAASTATAAVIAAPTQFSTLINSGGDTYAVVGDLIIENGGSILCNDVGVPGASACAGVGAGAIKITVTGNLVMKAGSAILAENNNGGGNGANIEITVGGDVTLCGPNSATAACAPSSPAAGATISSSRTSGGGGKAGNITITSGNFPNTPGTGVFTMEPGSQVLANATGGSGGEIFITAGAEMHVDGQVRSFGGIGGTGAGNPKGGGPITLKSGCKLIVTPDGVVSSEGEDPGADLVHLEGCEVEINGLVQSIGAGHVLPAAGNRCNDDPIAHPPGLATAFTACVEIWGHNVTINGVLPNKGEVNANGVRAPFRAWIDVIAQNDITIVNDTTGNHAVHANSATASNSNSFGGVVTLKALAGTFTSTGEAVQANATGPGSDGGVVTVQASGDVSLDTSSVEARSPNGSNTRGGVIGVRSFNGQVSGSNGTGELDAAGGGSGGVPGQVTLSACTLSPAVTYTGTVTPSPATINFPVCTGSPTPPQAFALQVDCTTSVCVLPEFNKLGVKFNDLNHDGVHDPNEPGLVDWEIHVFGTTAGGAAIHLHTLTTAGPPVGLYQFALEPGTYTVCETQKPGWTQTAPFNVPPPAGETLADCTGHTHGGTITPGPRGYTFTISPGVVLDGNDFGNFTGGGTCPKFPNLMADVTIVIDPNDATQIQKAIDALPLDKTLLIMPHLGKKVEKIVIDKRVTVVGCSVTLTTPDPSAPVVTVGAGAADGSTIDVHATGSNVAGYKIEGTDHLVRNARSFRNGIGFWITGNGNEVRGALGTTGNGVGFVIDGDGNLVDTASGVTGSTSHGAHITPGATGNTIKKSTFTGNGGEGILVEGPGNVVSENKLYSNALNGIRVTGADTTLLKNLAGDKNKGNGLDGIVVSASDGPVTQNTARGNKGNGIAITGSGHTLSKNVAGGDTQQTNALCQFVIGAGNVDGAGNKADGQEIAFNPAGAACVDP